VTPRFVVSSGRSGSTLLSQMLHLHRDVLSLFDLFVTLIPRAFPAGPVSGEEFWELLTRPHRQYTLMLRLGIATPEMRYRPGPGGRYTAETGVPPLLLIALPHLVEDPEALLDELGQAIIAFDARPIGEQYERLFAWLCRRLDRAVWVERSGSSLDWLEDLVAHFPDARFVHLYRDGRDCALSMTLHDGFKFPALGRRLQRQLGVDPYQSDREPAKAVPRSSRPFMPETFDRERYQALRLPVEEQGRTWSRMVVRGCELLGRLDPDRVLPLRYETLLAEPAVALRRLASFLEIAPDEPWLERAAGLVRPRPPRWTQLPEPERRELVEACAPGMRLLYGTETEEVP
jgi:putative sulfotransferase